MRFSYLRDISMASASLFLSRVRREDSATKGNPEEPTPWTNAMPGPRAARRGDSAPTKGINRSMLPAAVP